MKLIGKLFIPALFFLSFSLAAEETVRLKTVKFQIGDETFRWDEGEIPPEGGEGLSPLFLMSYTSLAPGEDISLKDLEKEAALFEQRLTESGLFYSAQVYIIPPRRFPETRTLMVKAEPGFFQRFGGGNAYGYFGRYALLGKRNFLEIFAGYNIAGFSYRDTALSGAPLCSGVSLFYTNSGLGDPEVPYHRITGQGTLGWRFSPDALLSLTAGYEQSWYETEEEMPGFLFACPSFSLALYPSAESFFCLGIKAEGMFSFNGETAFLAGGTLEGEFSSGAFSADIIASARLPFSSLPFSGQSFAENMLRAPVEEEGVPRDGLLRAGIQADAELIRFTAASFFPVSAGAFAFAEAALAYDFGEEILPENMEAAFGPGLSLIIGAPVFIRLEASVGWNLSGESQFNFEVKAY